MWVDNARVIATDGNHWSGTTMQNCDFLTANKQTRSCEKILISLGNKISENVYDCKVDLGLPNPIRNEHELSHVRQFRFNLVAKHKYRSRKSKMSAKILIFKSSAWQNLLCIVHWKNLLQRQTEEKRFWGNAFAVPENN